MDASEGGGLPLEKIVGSVYSEATDVAVMAFERDGIVEFYWRHAAAAAFEPMGVTLAPGEFLYGLVAPHGVDWLGCVIAVQQQVGRSIVYNWRVPTSIGSTRPVRFPLDASKPHVTFFPRQSWPSSKSTSLPIRATTLC